MSSRSKPKATKPSETKPTATRAKATKDKRYLSEALTVFLADLLIKQQAERKAGRHD